MKNFGKFQCQRAPTYLFPSFLTTGTDKIKASALTIRAGSSDKKIGGQIIGVNYLFKILRIFNYLSILVGQADS
jgi:hypothetical protein